MSQTFHWKPSLVIYLKNAKIAPNTQYTLSAVISPCYCLGTPASREDRLMLHLGLPTSGTVYTRVG